MVQAFPLPDRVGRAPETRITCNDPTKCRARCASCRALRGRSRSCACRKGDVVAIQLGSRPWFPEQSSAFGNHQWSHS